MPHMRIDPHSGAVLFSRTTEEKRTEELEKKVNELTKAIEKLAEKSK